MGPWPEEETNVDRTCREELEEYLFEKAVLRATNPLTWWNDNQHRFPRLAKVAQSLLNVPATSTPAERVFSVAGLTVTKLRSCLKPSNVDVLKASLLYSSFFTVL